MKITRFYTTALGIATSLAVFCLGSSASAQIITPLTGGDSTDGLNLTGLNVIYAVNQGENPSAVTIQGANFIAGPIVGNTFTGYSGNLVLSSMDRTDPGFSPAGWGSSANDLAMITLNSSISYGPFQQFAYQVTAGTQYTLFSIISPGGVGARPSDVAFFNGLASAFTQPVVVTGSTILADNLNVATNNASVVSYTYTATITGFNTLIVAGSDVYGTAGGGDQNSVSSGFLVATAVPEPSTAGLLALAGTGIAMLRRRRTAASA